MAKKANMSKIARTTRTRKDTFSGSINEKLFELIKQSGQYTRLGDNALKLAIQTGSPFFINKYKTMSSQQVPKHVPRGHEDINKARQRFAETLTGFFETLGGGPTKT